MLNSSVEPCDLTSVLEALPGKLDKILTKLSLLINDRNQMIELIYCNIFIFQVYCGWRRSRACQIF